MNNLLSIFDRMNAGQLALAVLFLCAIGAILIVGLESLRTSVKNYFIKRKTFRTVKIRNTFKNDDEIENIRDASKSYLLIALLVLAAYGAGFLIF